MRKEKRRHAMMNVVENGNVVLMLDASAWSIRGYSTMERLRPRRCAAEAQSD